MLAATNNSSTEMASAKRHSVGMLARWGHLPFLAYLASANLPLNYKLEASKQAFTSEVHEATLATTSSANSLNSITYVIVLLAIYLAAGAMVLRKPKQTLALCLRQWPLIGTLLLAMVSILWSHTPEKALINTVHYTGALLLALAAALHYRTQPWHMPRDIGGVLGVNIAVQLLAVAALPTYAIDWFGRWQGLTGNPNTLGVLALFTFWANTATLLYGQPDKYRLHLAGAALAAIAMIGANSVTSMTCALLAVSLIFALTRAGWTLRLIKWIAFSAILVGLPLALLFWQTGLDTAGLFGLAGRSGDISGRTDLWRDGFAAFVQQPWLGWGFDDNAYLIEITGFPFTSYHNGYLDAAVHLGIAGLLLLALSLLYWARDLKSAARLGRQMIPFSVPFVFAMLIHNITEAWLTSSRNPFWMIFLALVFLGACRRPSTSAEIGVNNERP